MPDWVIGRGLLGGAISGRSQRDVRYRRVRWHQSESAVADLTQMADGLAAELGPEGLLRVFWTAGAGVTSTPIAELRQEVAVFIELLGVLADRFGSRADIFLASSVGGVYAGNPAPPFDEFSEVRPLSAYGEAKADMEEALRSHVAAVRCRAVIGRVSNLYGPGQNLSKGQGLISTFAKTYLDGRAASVFVPLDTIRDYIYVDDAALVILAAMDRLETMNPGMAVTKIIASSTGTTIASLIGEFTRLQKSRPLVVLGGGNAAGQAADLRVQSRVWTDLDGLARTSLAEGVANTFHAMRSAWVERI